jgi:peptidoglycan hydrolase-like protein with peptidoglycan-binding domain
MNGTDVLRRVGVGVAAVFMAGAGLVVSAGSAAAQVPLCVKMVTYGAPAGIINVPANSDGRTTCLLGRDQAANYKIVTQFQQTMKTCYGGVFLASPYQNEKIQNLAADGEFGPRTEAALKGVQKYIRVTADGSYGPVTRDHMKFVSTNGRCLSYR